MAMCVKREGFGNLCGGLITILMLIIMFSIAHGRFQELMYVSVIGLGISLAGCVVFAVINAFFIKSDDLWPSTSTTTRSSDTYAYHGAGRLRYHQYNRAPQSRVHVCVPPRMGGARLNIVYTIDGDDIRSNACHQPLLLDTNRPDEVAINIDPPPGSGPGRPIPVSHLPLTRSRSSGYNQRANTSGHQNLVRIRSASRSPRRMPGQNGSSTGLSSLSELGLTTSDPMPLHLFLANQPFTVRLPPEEHHHLLHHHHQQQQQRQRGVSDDLPPTYDQIEGQLRPPTYQEAIGQPSTEEQHSSRSDQLPDKTTTTLINVDNDSNNNNNNDNDSNNNG